MTKPILSPVRARSASLLLALPLLAGLCLPAFAAEVKDVTPAPKEMPAQKVRVLGADGQEVQPPQPASEVESYCSNIADKAQDARYAAERSKLKDMEAKVDARIGELEKKRAAYQKWLAERQAFLDKASGLVVDIYAQMKAEAAAQQLSRLDASDAASVIVKLKARQASAILSEMKPDTAAALAALIVKKTSSASTETAAAGDASEKRS